MKQVVYVPMDLAGKIMDILYKIRKLAGEKSALAQLIVEWENQAKVVNIIDWNDA